MDEIKRSVLTRPDGVSLGVFDRPGPRPDAPVLFLVNGLGGNIVTWKHQIRALGATHRIVSWDYRGLYDSALTPAQKAAALAGDLPLDIPTHAQDGMAVLDYLGIERAIFVGWSMGVQLSFELWRVQRALGTGRCEGLIQIAGSYGRSLSTTRFGKAGELVAMPVMEVMRQVLERQGGRIQKAVESGRLMGVAKTLGLVARSMDEAMAKEIVGRYVELDFEVYNLIMRSLGEHDAEPWLGQVDVPVLIIAGDKDPMTPARLARRMDALLPDSALVIVRGGTHYVPAEFPERVSRSIAAFVDRRFPGRHVAASMAPA